MLEAGANNAGRSVFTKNFFQLVIPNDFDFFVNQKPFL